MSFAFYTKAQLDTQGRKGDQWVMNAMVDEKRSSPDGMTGTPGSLGHQAEGAGGRHRDDHPLTGGGGYSNNYTNPEPLLGAEKKIAAAPPDPRLADPRFAVLRRIGMHHRWLQLAERIGMDAFLELWRTLDEDETRAGTSILISMPRLSRFLRYQRNQFILELCRDGLEPVDIQKHLRVELCEHISLRHIARVIEKRENRG